MKPAPFSSNTKLDKSFFLQKKKGKRKYNGGGGGEGRNYCRRNINKRNRQPQFYRVCIYCRQLHNLPRREVSHGAIVSTKVNSFEASSSPLTLHCHPHGDTPLSSLKRIVNHWRKLCAGLSRWLTFTTANRVYEQAGTLHACCSMVDASSGKAVIVANVREQHVIHTS